MFSHCWKLQGTDHGLHRLLELFLSLFCEETPTLTWQREEVLQHLLKKTLTLLYQSPTFMTSFNLGDLHKVCGTKCSHNRSLDIEAQMLEECKHLAQNLGTL